MGTVTVGEVATGEGVEVIDGVTTGVVGVDGLEEVGVGVGAGIGVITGVETAEIETVLASRVIAV